jgi:hypothetical protein
MSMLDPFWTNIDIITGKVCPYCNVETRLVGEIEILGTTFSSRKYRQCIKDRNHYVMCDFSKGAKAMGRVADYHLRELGRRLRCLYNPLWSAKNPEFKSSALAKYYLAKTFEVPVHQFNFWYLNEEWCIYLIAFLELRQHSKSI